MNMQGKLLGDMKSHLGLVLKLTMERHSISYSCLATMHSSLVADHPHSFVRDCLLSVPDSKDTLIKTN